MRQQPPSQTARDEHPVELNVQAITKLEREAIDQQSPIDRLTAGITRVLGSPTFIAIHAVWFAIWIVSAV
jgi:uncharacterized membrane protein